MYFCHDVLYIYVHMLVDWFIILDIYFFHEFFCCEVQGGSFPSPMCSYFYISFSIYSIRIQTNQLFSSYKKRNNFCTCLGISILTNKLGWFSPVKYILTVQYSVTRIVSCNFFNPILSSLLYSRRKRFLKIFAIFTDWAPTGAVFNFFCFQLTSMHLFPWLPAVPDSAQLWPTAVQLCEFTTVCLIVCSCEERKPYSELNYTTRLGLKISWHCTC